MRKVALLFILAVFVPSLILAWLAIRSVRDQQYVIERQETILYQGQADTLVSQIQDQLDDLQGDFQKAVRAIVPEDNPRQVADAFDDQLRQAWPMAEVGFIVSLDGEVLAPSLFSGVQARQFRLANDRFLASRESVEVYWRSPQGNINLTALDNQKKKAYAGKKIMRKVAPIKSATVEAGVSDVEVQEDRFRDLLGDSQSGSFARYLQDELKVMFWSRLQQEPNLVYGAQVNLARLVSRLTPLIRVDDSLQEEICIALINDQGRPLLKSRDDLELNWQQPFVASEIGEGLPHWELGLYLIHPDRLNRAADLFQLTVGLLVLLLILAIGIGGWLITSDLRRQLALARQKTDFVSNVSHELKTPLTSIRMFAELLAGDRVAEPDRRKHFLGIIESETARLTRLINNVLDFSRMERGEKNYRMEPVNLDDVVRQVCDSYRPHLEAHEFSLTCHLPDNAVAIRADRDAVAQILVNLVSNAEKYSGEARDIEVHLDTPDDRTARVQVLDHGPGVPAGDREKIFEQFYRVHDSLSDGIQGSGLGLTLGRQIAQAHGGNIVCQDRPGGGSCFVLTLPRESVS